MADETNAPVAEKTAAEHPEHPHLRQHLRALIVWRISIRRLPRAAPFRSTDTRDTRGPRPAGPGGGRKVAANFSAARRFASFASRRSMPSATGTFACLRASWPSAARSPPAPDRCLHPAPAPSVAGHQAGAQHRPAAVRRPHVTKSSERQCCRRRIVLSGFSQGIERVPLRKGRPKFEGDRHGSYSEGRRRKLVIAATS